MSFDEHAQNHLKTLQKKRQGFRNEQYRLMHECDCEFCDVDEIDDMERYEELQKEIDELDETIARLKRYAERHQIPLEVK